MRRSNAVRSRATREGILRAAGQLFADRGFAETSTPEIAAKARVTRGALYHHFADKRDVFRAVVEQEHALVAAEIEKAAPGNIDPVEAIIAGGEAFLDAMSDPGRRRILLVEAPAVLGMEGVAEIDTRHAGRTLVEGIAAAIAAGRLRPLPKEALAAILNGVYDRASLAPPDDRANRDYRAVIRAIIEGLAVSPLRPR